MRPHSHRLPSHAFPNAPLPPPQTQKERFDIISDFTRQHKAMQDELIARITVLENTICDLKDQLGVLGLPCVSPFIHPPQMASDLGPPKTIPPLCTAICYIEAKGRKRKLELTS